MMTPGGGFQMPGMPPMPGFPTKDVSSGSTD
jgi:hypothetical protein